MSHANFLQTSRESAEQMQRQVRLARAWGDPTIAWALAASILALSAAGWRHLRRQLERGPGEAESYRTRPVSRR
jgi:hypothetical protein